MPWIEFDEKLLHAESGATFIKVDCKINYYKTFKIIAEFETEEARDARWQELKILLGIMPSKNSEKLNSKINEALDLIYG